MLRERSLAWWWVLTMLPSIWGSAGEDTLLSQEQLTNFFSREVFMIRSEQLDMCIRVDTFGIVLANCSRPSVKMLWKWVSRNHLFNYGSSGCLGLNIRDEEQPLGMFECDNARHALRWDCHNNELMSGPKYRLVPENGQVVARRLSHKWKHFTTQDDNLCAHPLQEVYTLRGNGGGAPCVFPFKFNNTWYPECTREGRDSGMLWCATSAHYDRDKRWGFCPSDDIGCDTFWEKRSDMQVCYQFNLFDAVSWSEARSSCQAQGGDLLSITDLPEQKYVSKQLSSTRTFTWTGLNNLDGASGWQWSDGSPLALVNWKSELSHGPLTENYCGVFNSRLLSWQSFRCESRLPYACKKYLNRTKIVPFDLWKYYPTHCDSGWFAYNRNCYKLQTEKQSWNNASSSCKKSESELISITSLSEVELLSTLLDKENVTETWIGLISNTTQAMFTWNDGTPVTLTNWHKHEPIIIQGPDKICASTHGSEGHWNVRRCEEEIFSVCKKAGLLQTSLSAKEIGCQEDWERHGEFCYRIDNSTRSFENASSGHYCPLLTVANRFEQAFVNSLINNLVTSEDNYIWIALQDENSTGEYRWKTNKGSHEAVRYTNWNKHQPSHTGGCIAMRSGSQAGRWEVKECQSFEAMSFCKQPVKLNEENQPSEDEDSEYFDRNFNEDNCFHGWESEIHLHNCYKVFHVEKVLTKRTWDEAEEFCQGFGAHLASFSHGDEEIFLDKHLNTMFSPTDRRRFWIGLNRRNPLSGGSWEWSDGTPVISQFIQDMYTDDHAKICATFKADNLVVPLNCASKLEWICSIPKGAEIKIPDWHVRDLPWTFFRGAEYFFYGDASSFQVFRFACGWLGGSLLTIHSQTEQEFIAAKLKKSSKGGINWWIGLLAENPGDQFRWEDGLPLVYQNWDSERNRTVPVDNTRCGYISKETGLWGDVDCEVALPGICKSTRKYLLEKEIQKGLNISETQHGECPKEWLYFGNKCFLVEITKDNGHSEDWFSAQTYCSKHDGRLASIENKLEQAFITMQLFGHKSSFWIGKHKAEISSENGDTLKYSNWSPMNITQHHADGHSSDIPQQESLCTLMSNNHNVHITGKWYLDNCNNKGYGFVCEKEQDTSKRRVPESDMYPLADVLEYGNRTYRILRGNMSWTEAMNICLENGAQLVSIADQYYQAFLTIIVNRIGHPHWIGLSRVNEESDFHWSDGTRSLLTSWRDEGSQFLGECAYIDTEGDWSTDDCETILQGAVCHVPIEQRISEDKGICPETDVPWIQFKNNCYSFSTVLNSTTMPEAYRFCKQQGSDLLSIKDEEENTFLIQQLRHFHSTLVFIWLNIIYKQENDSVMWYDETPLNYSNWAAGEPEWDPRSDLCVAVAVLDGQWVAIDCRDESGFICKARADVDKEVTPEPSEASFHGIIPLAVVVIIIVIILLSFLLCAYKRKKYHSWKIPFFTASTPASEFEETILITELEPNHG